DRDGGLRVPVGATLVRHSRPESEVAETHAKAAGVLAALGVRPGRPREESARPRLADDPGVRAALDARRADLAPFWLRMRTASATLTGHALVVDGEDTFTAMLAHVLRSSGLEVTVRRFDEPDLRAAVRGHEGPVVLGPGPGDPADTTAPRMRMLRGLAGELVRDRRGGLLGVCLGHELIAAELGLETVRKRVPYQGAQTRIDLFGRAETAGFYNSFTARCDDATAGELAARGVEVSRDADSGEVYALRGDGFASVQFHPESVLTLNGREIVAELLAGAMAFRRGLWTRAEWWRCASDGGGAVRLRRGGAVRLRRGVRYASGGGCGTPPAGGASWCRGPGPPEVRVRTAFLTALRASCDALRPDTHLLRPRPPPPGGHARPGARPGRLCGR
ncbi:hypothetical protein ACFRFS_11410, partial [Streptomyces sp. NPDC056730]